MEIVRLHQSQSDYPPSLRKFLNSEAPESVAASGNLDLLRQNSLAFFCSVKCPASLILQTHDLAQKLPQCGVAVVGGFHSPIEQECLRVLLRGVNPLIISPARALENMRMGRDYRAPLRQGRLLLISPFINKPRRPTLETVQYRNRFVAALADKVFVAYTEPSGKTELLMKEILSWGKPIYTLDDEANRSLIRLGAQPVTAGQVPQLG